jgi:hypothetical protein
MHRLFIFVLSSLLFLTQAYGEVKEVTERKTYTEVEAVLSSDLSVKVTKEEVSDLKEKITVPKTPPKLVDVAKEESEKVVLILAGLASLFSLLALWGFMKNVFIAFETMRREGLSVKVISQLLVAVTLLIVLIYSLLVLSGKSFIS